MQWIKKGIMSIFSVTDRFCRFRWIPVVFNTKARSGSLAGVVNVSAFRLKRIKKKSSEPAA